MAAAKERAARAAEDASKADPRTAATTKDGGKAATRKDVAKAATGKDVAKEAKKAGGKVRCQMVIKAEPQDEPAASSRVAAPMAAPCKDHATAGGSTHAKKMGRGTSLSDATAAKLAKVAEEQGKTIKALREQFKRTFEADPRTDRDAKKRPTKTEDACPQEIIEQLKAADSVEPWLKTWLERGGSWLTTKSFEEQKDEDVDEDGATRAWLTEEQMEELFKSNIVVAALKKKYLDKPETNRVHPDIPECAEAHQYWTLVDESKKSILRAIQGRGHRANADVDPAAAVSVFKPRGQPAAERARVPHSGGAPPRTCPPSGSGREEPEVPKEAVEDTPEAAAMRKKAEKAATLKAQRDKAAKDPQVQKIKWLKGAADLVSKTKEKQGQAKKVVFPNCMHKTYETTFGEHNVSIKDIRDWLESKHSKAEVKKKLDEVKSLVETINKDIKAFDDLKKTYSS